MKLRHILEGKNVGIVYHFTRLFNAIEIVNSNQIKAYRATKNIDGETISTTRDKNFSKHRSDSLSISGADIIFVLDGNKLSNIYQVKPYDDTFDSSYGEYDEDDKINFGDEREELWFGKKLEQDGGFKNLNKFVLKIIITKRLIYKVTYKPETLFNIGKNTIVSVIGNQNELELNPIGIINKIKKWFESQGYTVEIEK